MKKKRMYVGIVTIGVVCGTILNGCSNETMTQKEMPSGMKGVIEVEARAVYPEEPVFKTEDERWEANREKRMSMPETFAAAYDRFSVETAAGLLKDCNENTVYSPLSLYYALALAASGAEGNTQEEMLRVLGYKDMESLTSDCKTSFESLYHVPNEENNKPNEWGEYDTESRYSLAIANALWADDSLEIKESFAKDGAENFYADVFKGDLQSLDVAEARAEWVNERTNGLIIPAAEPEREDSVLAIMNTVYFYDEWITRFDKEQTKEDVFTCMDGTEINCDFMNLEEFSAGFRRGENYTAASLSLKNGDMVFVLPNKGVSVQELVKDAETLSGAIGEGGEILFGRVTWKVPKFSYGSNLQLADMLRVLGMNDAFSSSADFTGISDTETLFISTIKQDAHLGIDEDGVEGAAYTAIMFAGAGLPKDQAEMILDRPFLYAVRNRGRVVFVGICENPTLE